MFQRDAEEHYFGSIVLQTVASKNSVVGSVLVKRDKRDETRNAMSNELTVRKANQSSNNLIVSSDVRRSMATLCSQNNRRSVSLSKEKCAYLSMQRSTFMTHNDQ